MRCDGEWCIRPHAFLDNGADKETFGGFPYRSLDGKQHTDLEPSEQTARCKRFCCKCLCFAHVGVECVWKQPMKIVLDESGDPVGDWKTGAMNTADRAGRPSGDEAADEKDDGEDADEDDKAGNRRSEGGGATAYRQDGNIFKFIWGCGQQPICRQHWET